LTSSGPEKKVYGAFSLFFRLKNEAKIRMFKALDLPSSVCGWQVMAKKR